MPAGHGRRHTGYKGVSVAGKHQSPDEIRSRTSTGYSTNAPTGECDSDISMPTHPSMPDIPGAQGELFFECTFFLFSVKALFLQHLNLYRSNWWLPYYNSNWIALKWNLVNPYLVSCIGLILGRRVTWCFLKKLSFSEIPGFQNPPMILTVLEWVLKIPFLCAVFTSFLFSLLQVAFAFPSGTLFYLLYPIILYLIMFRKEIGAAVVEPSVSQKLFKLWNSFHLSAFSNVGTKGFGHACSTSSSHIREEVEILQSDLLFKLRHSGFSAFCTSYYAVFLPSCFVPAYLHTDPWWTAELCLIVFLTGWALHLTCVIPLAYCDLLHRSSTHLGQWQKMESHRGLAAINMPYAQWDEQKLYSYNDVVKYGRSLYRAYGVSVAAEPGNGDHFRFYYVFCEPLYLLGLLFWIDAVLILVQFVMLIHSTDWQHIVTLVFMMFGNYVMLFKVFKEKVVLGRVYHPSNEDKRIINREL